MNMIKALESDSHSRSLRSRATIDVVIMKTTLTALQRWRARQARAAGCRLNNLDHHWIFQYPMGSNNIASPNLET